MSGGAHFAAVDRPSAPDAALVTHAQRGSTAAFDELFRRHAHPAWRLATAIGGNPAVAEAAVADAFTTVFRQLASGSETVGTPFRVLVARAAANAAAANAVGRTATADANKLVTSFRHLPRHWRAALWLTAVEGGSARESGTLLGVSEEAFAGLASRADAGLRQRFVLAGGAQDDPLLDDIGRSLKPLVGPMPVSVHATAAALWNAWRDSTKAERRHGLGVVLPLGPRVERAVAGAAAAVLTAGIAAAVALGGKEATRRPEIAAAGSGELAGGAVNASGSGPTDGGAAGYEPVPSTVGPARPRTSATTADPVIGDSFVISKPPASIAAPQAPTTTPPAPAPALPPTSGTGATIAVGSGESQITVGIGDETGVRVGSVEVGSPPPATEGGTVAIEVDTGGLLPPILISLP